LTISIVLVNVVWGMTLSSHAQSNSPLTPITVANAAQIKPIFTDVTGPGGGNLLSPDGSLIVISENYGQATYPRLYDLRIGRPLPPFSGTNSIDAFSLD
jgi:hypothetical protein